MSAPLETSIAAEAELLAALRAGDERAFEALVRTHGPRLLALTRRYTRTEEDAQEALQDAFVSAFRGLDRFEGGALLSTWLHRIAVNAALMIERRRSRRREQDIEELLPVYGPGGHRIEPPAAWSEPVGAELEREELRTLVLRSIAQLPENYRTVLVLRDIEELDLAEIAARLDITPGAAKIRVHRARQALRTLLDPHLRADAPRGSPRPA